MSTVALAFSTISCVLMTYVLLHHPALLARSLTLVSG
jgi:hypothetical protein